MCLEGGIASFLGFESQPTCDTTGFGGNGVKTTDLNFYISNQDHISKLYLCSLEKWEFQIC